MASTVENRTPTPPLDPVAMKTSNVNKWPVGGIANLVKEALHTIEPKETKNSFNIITGDIDHIPPSIIKTWLGLSMDPINGVSRWLAGEGHDNLHFIPKIAEDSILLTPPDAIPPSLCEKPVDPAPEAKSEDQEEERSSKELSSLRPIIYNPKDTGFSTQENIKRILDEDPEEISNRTKIYLAAVEGWFQLADRGYGASLRTTQSDPKKASIQSYVRDGITKIITAIAKPTDRQAKISEIGKKIAASWTEETDKTAWGYLKKLRANPAQTSYRDCLQDLITEQLTHQIQVREEATSIRKHT